MELAAEPCVWRIASLLCDDDLLLTAFAPENSCTITWSAKHSFETPSFVWLSE